MPSGGRIGRWYEMKEFMLGVREYLKSTIALSEKKLNKNKEDLEIVENILKKYFDWADSEEPTTKS